MEPTDQQAELDELRAKLSTAERQRDEALAALRPFAERFEKHKREWAEDEKIIGATVGDFRRAWQVYGGTMERILPGIAGPEQQPETERDNGA